MGKNPFAGESKFQKKSSAAARPLTAKEQAWGKTKFNPFKKTKAITNGAAVLEAVKSLNPFKNESNNNRQHNNNSRPSQRGKPQFRRGGGANNKFGRNAGGRSFKPAAVEKVAGNATPWNNFKDELLAADEGNKDNDLHDSAAAKQMLKERENNYRKNVILGKKKEPTKWESFVEEKPQQAEKKKHKKDQKKHKQEMNNDVDETAAAAQEKKKHKKSKKNKKQEMPNDGEEELKSSNKLNAKTLNIKEINKLRQTITKATIMQSRPTLEMNIADIKRVKQLKKLKKEQRSSYQKH